jgi:hypothetical protein
MVALLATATNIRQIFEEELTKRGAPITAVSWVFAPNSWSESGDEFEDYYPGTDVVDVVSTTGFNFGGCPGPNAVWDTFDRALKPYLDRLGRMAPDKPQFIAETGTVDVKARAAPSGGFVEVATRARRLLVVFQRLSVRAGQV